MVNKITPVNKDGVINSSSARLKAERIRLGLSQKALGKFLGVSKWTVINYERTGARGTPIPADLLAACSRIGMDVQYIITNVASSNLNRVAEEAGTYRVEPARTTVLSKGERQLLDTYRSLKPAQQSHAQAIVDALGTAKKRKGRAATTRRRRLPR